MKITRIIALGVIAASVSVPALNAQTLRNPSPPAEYPPLSYQAKQYVDSRGCIYIRAGIDGNVNWVPRVTRSRKQLCGYQPTKVAGTTKSPARSTQSPELITLSPEQQAPQTAAAKPAPVPAAPARPAATAQTAPQKPQQTAAAPAAKPQPAPVIAPAPKAAPKPAAAAPAAAPVNPCPGASAISQQYTNQSGVRCGPQSKSPVTYGSPQSSLQITPNTRVMPVHVYQDRRLSQGLQTPAGYKAVWDDGRLNPRRAERTVRPAVLSSRAVVPAGYVQVEREDGRLNPNRGIRTAAGDAQMAQIWTDGVPRKLVDLPLDRPTVRVPYTDARSSAEAAEPTVLRLSTRSAPGTVLPSEKPRRRYVRAATFADAAEAQAAAKALSAKGLPVRMGKLMRRGKAYKVVLAGPFTADETARAALGQVQAAGYPQARLSK